MSLGPTKANVTIVNLQRSRTKRPTIVVKGEKYHQQPTELNEQPAILHKDYHHIITTYKGTYF